MATESQFRAVFETLSQTAKSRGEGVSLNFWSDGYGKISSHHDPENPGMWEDSADAPAIIERFGIPIAPDPPAEPPDDDARERQKFVNEALAALCKACPLAERSWFEERLDELLAVRDRAFKAATPPKGD